MAMLKYRKLSKQDKHTMKIMMLTPLPHCWALSPG